MRALLRLLVLFRPYAGWMGLGILASSLTLLANLALLAISGWFIASMALAGAAGVSMNYFTPAAMIRAAAILRTGGRYAERLLTHEATLRLLAGLRIWFYRHLEPLAPAGLEGYRSGDLLSRIRADIDTLDNLYIRLLVPLCVAILGVTGVTWIMAAYAAQLALILLGMLLLGGLILPLWVKRLAHKPGRARTLAASELRTQLVDGIQGMAELTVYGAGDESAARISQSSRRLILTQERISHITGVGQAGVLLSANLALWGVTLTAVPLVGSGGIAPEDLALLALFTLAAFESVMPLPDAFRLLGQTSAAARRLLEIVDRQPLVADPTDTGPTPAQFHLRFESVCFRYGNEEPLVLQGIDLALRPGERKAVIGPTGAGKSSLIGLLLRFWEPESGRITLDGVSLDNYTGEQLRDWIAVVPQQIYLFNTTIRENLKLANPAADREDLERACRIAQIHDFILSQPQGYDTWVGETGVRLSGGQIRRIGIARALLREFRLLVLDEPGEGLDAATHKALMEALLEHLGARSLLLITHQPVGLDSLDEIMQLEEGKFWSQLS